MIRTATAIGTALVLVGSALTVPAPSWAGKGGTGGGKATRTAVQAQLAPCCDDPEPGAQGEARRKSISKNGGLLVDSFEASVEIPVPSTGLGVTDPTTADVRLVLSRGGTDYAECFFALDQDENAQEPEGDDDDDDNGQGATAEFKVKVLSTLRNGSPVVKQVQGQCDIDLATAGVQPGVPAVQAGDVATIRVVNSGTPTDFLQGTFNAKH